MPSKQEVHKPLLQRSFTTTGGYIAYSPWSLVKITIFNAILASFFLLMSLPVIAIVGLIIKLRDKGPIFYKGTRLGLGKRHFEMYKFRTLPVGAQQLIGQDVLRPHHFKLSRFTKFLRDSRLDELPQLINVLQGEMDFLGPRPIRPEVYEKVKASTPNYDNRFSVRPGLLGYAQLFTPHSSPKRLRSMINNQYAKQERRLSGDLFIIFGAFALVVLTALKKAKYHLTEFYYTNIIQRYRDARELDRVYLKDAIATVIDEASNVVDDKGFLTDINDNYFRLLSNVELDDSQLRFLLKRKFTRNGQIRSKTARCRGNIFRKISGGSAYRYGYIITYSAETDLNQYKIDQYFLRKSIG